MAQNLQTRPEPIAGPEGYPATHNLLWRKPCPVCGQSMTKQQPTETVPCACGKYIWKG